MCKLRDNDMQHNPDEECLNISHQLKNNEGIPRPECPLVRLAFATTDAKRTSQRMRVLVFY